MASSTSTGVEIVVQLKSSSIHCTDVQRVQEDEPTQSKTKPCKKRKIKVSDE